LGGSLAGTAGFIPEPAGGGGAKFRRIELGTQARQVRHGLFQPPLEAWRQLERLLCQAS
jgi:hypothetical protein